MVWSTQHDDETGDFQSFHPSPPNQIEAANAKTYLDHCSSLDINSAPPKIRLTGIINTIGRSLKDPVFLEKMMECGMNIARINLSFGTKALHAEIIQNIRSAAESYSRRLGVPFPVGIALDTKGPEIRTGNMEGGINAEVELKKGDQIKLTSDLAFLNKGNASVIYVDFDNIHKVVQVGNRIYIDDGIISVICTNIQGVILTCTVENSGMLGSCKGINLPGIEFDLPSVTERDIDGIRFGVEQGVDFIFASFIREASAITEVRNILGPQGSKIMVVAKIENQQGMQHIDEIIQTADGIMVGRGDLGSELPIEKLFLAQKSIIAKCNRAGKPVICSNQILHSMMTKSRPTRAECTDAANAVLDGADCVMLNIETPKGDYPLQAITVMSKISKEAEAAFWTDRYFREVIGKVLPPVDPCEAIAIAAVEAASKCLAAAIIVVTISGRSAHLVSKCKPRCPILTVTRNLQTARQSHLYRGIFPLPYTASREAEWTKDIEARISYGITFGKWKRFIRNGDSVVAIHGTRRGSGFTDTLRVLYITKPPEEGADCECKQ